MVRFIFVLLIVFLLSVISVNAGIEDVTVVTAESSPAIIEPGNDVAVKVQVFNADDIEHDMTVELEASPYFFLKSSSKNFREEFTLCKGCAIENTYYLTIKPETLSGAYRLVFFVREEQLTFKREVSLEVRGVPDVVFDAVLKNDSVAPGDNFQVDIDVLNTGSATAQDLKITPESENFLVLGSGLRLFDVLPADERRQYSIDFYASKDVEAKAYTIPFSLVYKDDQGRQYNVTQNIGINIIDKAELALKDLQIDPVIPRQGEQFTIEGRVENTGEGDADSVRATLQSDMKGVKMSYLGTLEKDDDGPVFFSGIAQESGEKTEALVITYDDDRGSYTLTEEFSYTVAPRSNVLPLSVLVLVAFVLVFWSWWKRRGK